MPRFTKEDIAGESRQRLYKLLSDVEPTGNGEYVVVLDALSLITKHKAELAQTLDGLSVTHQIWSRWNAIDPRPNDRRVFYRIMDNAPISDTH